MFFVFLMTGYSILSKRIILRPSVYCMHVLSCALQVLELDPTATLREPQTGCMMQSQAALPGGPDFPEWSRAAGGRANPLQVCTR